MLHRTLSRPLPLVGTAGRKPMDLCLLLIVKAAQMLNRLLSRVAMAVQTQTVLLPPMVMAIRTRTPLYLLVATVVRKQNYWRLQAAMAVQMPNRLSRRQMQKFQ